MRVFFHKQRAAVGDTKYEKEFVDKIFDRVNFDGNSVMSAPEDVSVLFLVQIILKPVVSNLA